MKFSSVVILAGTVTASVPCEHSHQKFLTITQDFLTQPENPLDLVDSVFGLLGNAAAAKGAGKVTDLDCLQQSIADQAFTNAKASKNITGMAGALVYRALERNTPKVGGISATCTQKAINAEIAALSQHQDAASSVAANNLNIELALAVQLASIGADPLLALQSGTFAAGNVNDNTGKGNCCDDANDANGCIFTLNLLTPLATSADISKAVAAVKTAKKRQTMSERRAAAVNVQKFTGALGGAAPPVLFTSGADRPFNVDGSTFLKQAAAIQRSCSVQHNACANAANSGTLAGGAAQCETQEDACNAASGAAAKRAAAVNVQKFTGALGGAAPPVLFTSGADRPFNVDGSTFLKQAAAIQRSCSVQHNACANAANSGSLAGGAAQCETQEDACNAASGAAAKRAALDFGSCGSPAIEFAAGLDGRKEDSFKAVNQKDFNHGSALNIAVIAGFNCDRLASNCKASADAVTACKAGATAAQALGKTQAAADAFNKALGVTA